MGKVVKTVAAIGIAVAIAVAAPALAPALLSAIGTTTATALATTAATAIIGIGLSLAAGAIMAAVAGRPVSASASPQTFRQSIVNARIIYGMRRAGGVIVFFHPKKVGKKHYRYFVVAIAGHRCAGANRFFLNDEVATVDGSGKVTSGPYAGGAWLWFERGASNAAANPTFVAECDGKWTANHVGRDVAKLYAKFEMTDAVVEAGFPNMTVEVIGKDDIRDPRTGVRGYMRNAVAVFYDWMATPREDGGFGAYADEIPDDDWLSAMFNVASEAVPLRAGGTEDRYAFDSVIEVGAAPSEVRSTFVTCCAGSYTYSGGKHLMRPGYWVPVSARLDEDDLAGPISVPLLGEEGELATEVSGTFIDPDTLYQPQPVPTRSIPSADVRQGDYDLPHITSHPRGQRILEIMLRRAQAEKRVSWPMNIMGLGIAAMDTVQLGTPRYGLSNYAFAVKNWGLSSDFSVVLGLREENEDIYTWNAAMELLPGEVPTLAKAEPINNEDPNVLQLTIRNSFIVEVTSGIAILAASADGKVTVANHTRRYTDGDVAVQGATISTGLPANTAISIAYDDSDRRGGVVSFVAYQDDADAFADSTHPARHNVGYVTIPATGTSTGGGGGAGGGRENACVVDTTILLLADDAQTGAGKTITASAVTAGDWAWTQHEVTREWGAYRITDISFHDADVFSAEGLPYATGDHQFDRDGWWSKAKSIGEPAGRARVAKITVEGARTYVTVQPDGTRVLNHNIKATQPEE